MLLSTSVPDQQLIYALGGALASLLTHKVSRVVVVCGTHLCQDKAGSLRGVSWRFDNSKDASPYMIGKYGAPR